MEQTKLEKLEELARDLTKCGESAGAFIGDDIKSVIESSRFECGNDDDKDIDELVDLVEGEVENIIEIAKQVLKDVEDIKRGN